MLKRPISKLFCKNKASADRYNQILAMAKMINGNNPEGLHGLIVALLRPLQAERLLSVAESDEHMAASEVDYQTFFFDLAKVINSSECFLRPTPLVRVSLAGDIVLPTPWHRDRYANALSNIGAGRQCGAWTQDSNHKISVILPWKISFVSGGNHSIAAGILSGQGGLTADEVFDFSPIFDRVVCDGESYRDKVSNSVIDRVNDYRRAAVFEIGRMMVTS